MEKSKRNIGFLGSLLAVLQINCANWPQGKIESEEDLFHISYVIGHQILYILQEDSLPENNPNADCIEFFAAIAKTIKRHEGRPRRYGMNFLAVEYEMPGGTKVLVSLIPVQGVQSQTRREINVTITPESRAKRRIFHGKIVTECRGID